MSLRPSVATRKNGYKKGVTGDEARRKREEKLVQIRKNKRLDSLKKRRNGSLLNDNTHLHRLEPKLEHLSLMVQAVSSNDSSWQLEATTLFRKLLTGQCPPIDEVVKAGVVPRFVEFLDEDNFPQLQIEAAWVLANIASGRLDHVQLILQLGSIPKFVRLLGSSIADVREQAVWALANIAGDSPDCRDHVLSGGALVPLLAQLNEHAKLTLIRSITWTLSNLCCGKPPPPFEQVKPALPALSYLINSEDEEVLSEACWALSFICDASNQDGSSQNIQFVIEAGVCPHLLQLLAHPSPSVLVPTLQTLGNIVSGNDAQTQFVIDNQGLPPLYRILTKNCERRVKKEACWVISNITAGNGSQIQAVIEANIIPPVVSLLQHAEFEIKKEAAWAISNAISGGSHEQIQYLVSQGCIKPLCDLLICSDPEIIMVCLDGVESILESGEANKELGIHQVNVYLPIVDECEGLDKIEDLQSHKNNEVYEQAVKILEKYWNKEEIRRRRRRRIAHGI